MNFYILFIIILLTFLLAYKVITKLLYVKKSIFKISEIKWSYNIKLITISYVLLLLSIIFSIWASIIAFLNTKKTKHIKNSNTNIVFVLDVSKSMNSLDINYNWQITTRLKFAKQAILNYVKKHPDYRYSLVIFAWQAQAIVPLTNDINIFSTFLEWVDYRNLTKQWTNFSQALKLAIERFKNAKWSKNLVLISDGWDNWDYQWLNFKFPRNIKSFIFWVWSEKWGKIFIWTDPFWEPIFERYRWSYVITRLNRENLKRLANDISWKYFDLKTPNSLNILDKYIKPSSDNQNNSENKIKFDPNLIIILTFLSFISLIASILIES